MLEYSEANLCQLRFKAYIFGFLFLALTSPDTCEGKANIGVITHRSLYIDLSLQSKLLFT